MRQQPQRPANWNSKKKGQTQVFWAIVGFSYKEGKRETGRRKGLLLAFPESAGYFASGVEGNKTSERSESLIF